MDQWMAGMAHFFMQYGEFGLFVLAFVEASFFPVPPYLLSIPMTLANPKLAFYYALIGTAGSVLGGLLGYTIGYRLGRPILVKIVKPATLVKFEAIYQRYGDWATAAGGLTPLPYKIFAIAAGVFRTRLATFIPASIFARGIRFFTEALLLIVYGKRVLKFLESAFGPTNLAVIAVLLLIIILAWRAGIIPEKLSPIFQKLWRQWLAWAVKLRKRFFPAGLFSWYLITGSTLTAFGFLIFSKLASELLEHELSNFDNRVSRWIIAFRSDWLTVLMRGITGLGTTFWVIGLIIFCTVIGLHFRKRLAVITLNIVMLGALLLTELLKATFHRPRPELPWLTPASGYSFPSGHSLISLTLYGFLAYLIFRNITLSRWRFALAGGLLLLPVLIGTSRIYLGVHYPSDVLAGWAIATGWVGTCAMGLEFLNSKSSRS
jgi:undecaprenyl-diphosphatase